MIFDFLKKEKKQNEKIELIQIMLMNLKIPDDQKSIYIQALDILDDQWIDRVYVELTNFVNNIELKSYRDMQKNTFAKINWLREKEAEEKKKELNSFNYLFSKF